MSRKKMYRLLAFIIGTFALLGIVVAVEFRRFSDESDTNLYTEKQLDGAKDTNKQNTIDQAVSNSLLTDDVAENKEKSEVVPMEEDTSDSDNTDSIVPLPWEDITLVISGDINLTKVIQNRYDQAGLDGILEKKFSQELINADIALVNQEFAFTNRGTKAADKQYTFRTAPEYVQIFKDMGIDIVSLANNHSMDYGIVGLTDSFDTLNAAGIRYIGAGNNITEAREIKYMEVKNKKIAFLGASRVIPVPDWNAYKNKPGMLTTYDPAMLIEDIKTAKAQSDFVVVYVHWGKEGKEYPEDYQRSMAKQYIDAGADLVVGSHPHVLQGMEYYNGKPIIYSLGNFMFYSNINRTALLKVLINEQNEAKIELIPGKAENALTYSLEDSSEIDDFYRYMTDISFGVEFDQNGLVNPMANSTIEEY